MNREDIIRMAREAWLSDKEAQLITEFDEAYISCTYLQDLERFATLVVSAKREKFCDSNCVWTDHHPDCKLAQPEQEPVAWRYKPVREDNPRWEYTTNHPLDMGDGYLRPSLVEYCKCIEPLYAKEKPKLMLEKFREMKDLLDDTTPPQRKPLTDEELFKIWVRVPAETEDRFAFARAIEAAHGIKGKA